MKKSANPTRGAPMSNRLSQSFLLLFVLRARDAHKNVFERMAAASQFAQGPVALRRSREDLRSYVDAWLGGDTAADKRTIHGSEIEIFNFRCLLPERL